MSRSAIHIRMMALVCVLILSLIVVPAQALAQRSGEPTPRFTPTAVPGISASPTEAMGQQPVTLVVTGIAWPSSQGGVVLAWDALDRVLAGPFQVNPDGSFQKSVVVPAGWAAPGTHWVLAVGPSGFEARASVRLLAPLTDTPTITPTPSPSPTPSRTPFPTSTPTPVTPTSTFTPSPTFTPLPTLRPVTPVVTATPQGRPPIGPTARPTQTPQPTATATSSATSELPTATPLSFLQFTPDPTSTATSSPTLTSSPTPSSSPTPTATSTSTQTPVPAGAGQAAATGGTPVAAVHRPSQAGASEVAGMPLAGSSWESVFVQGFIAAILLIVLLTAFMVVVMVVLLVAWRIMKMRQAQGRMIT